METDPTPIALITGGGRGIGRGICLALAHAGWRVGINFRGDLAAAQETLHLVEAEGGEGMLLQGDIASAADRDRILSELLARWHRLDLLVNNAGMGPRHRVDLLEVGEASYDEVMAVNLKGPFFLAQAAAKIMLKQKSGTIGMNGTIINISSISAYTASLNRGEYCISKAGMSMMTALFASRLAEDGIGVYEIRPGIVETDMTANFHAKYDPLIADGITPIRRWGQPEDIGKAVVALASGAFAFSTGDVINVDGGFHLRRL
jgi:NAD(P)-dependent dehydrogenase (short-subunit alcohol dehydrogenase family)